MIGPLAFSQLANGGSDASRPSDVDQPSPPSSEIQAGAYLGGSIALPSDVLLKTPDDTDLVLKDVKWVNESLIDSPFYGAR